MLSAVPVAFSTGQEHGGGKVGMLCGTLCLDRKPSREHCGREQSAGAGSAPNALPHAVCHAIVIWAADPQHMKDNCRSLLAVMYF